jgi:hypothetical protein
MVMYFHYISNYTIWSVLSWNVLDDIQNLQLVLKGNEHNGATLCG